MDNKLGDQYIERVRQSLALMEKYYQMANDLEAEFMKAYHKYSDLLLDDKDHEGDQRYYDLIRRAGKTYRKTAEGYHSAHGLYRSAVGMLRYLSVHPGGDQSRISAGFVMMDQLSDDIQAVKDNPQSALFEFVRLTEHRHRCEAIGCLICNSYLYYKAVMLSAFGVGK